MMHDVIERFRYRFQLWWQDQREDLSWLPGPHLARLGERPLEQPKYRILITEPTVRSLARSFISYFGVLIIAMQLCRLIARFVPSTRHALGVALLVFLVLWTLLMLWGEVDLRKARKAYRAKTTESSNQPLQLTADRRDDQVSIHEPPFTSSFPPFRQR
jgi:hypothetical protein